VGTPTGQSINSDPYLNDPGELIFDISAAKPQANGSYLWNIKGTGPLAASDILEIIKRRQGRHRHREHGFRQRRNRRTFHAGQWFADIHAAARAARVDG
jgi:hypothetical protein